MTNCNLIELSPGEAFERMQVVHEKVYLDYVYPQEIEELKKLEYILHDSIEEFQSEFWL